MISVSAGQSALSEVAVVRAVVAYLRILRQLRFGQGVAGIAEDLLQRGSVIPPGGQLSPANSAGKEPAASAVAMGG